MRTSVLQQMLASNLSIDPESSKAEERRKKKLLSKTSWYRPASAVMHVTATPGAELADDIQKIITEADLDSVPKPLRLMVRASDNIL